MLILYSSFISLCKFCWLDFFEYLSKDSAQVELHYFILGSTFFSKFNRTPGSVAVFGLITVDSHHRHIAHVDVIPVKHL